jgi:hypothetical protein
MSLHFSPRHEARFAYPLGLLLVVASSLEILARIWPIKPYLIQWRFQTELAVVNAAPVMLIGLLLLLLVAWAAEHTSVLRVTSVLSALFGVALVPVLVLLLLDSSEVRQMANANVRDAIRSNSLVALVRGGLGALAALSLAVGGWRLARSEAYSASPRGRRASREDGSGESDLLIVRDSQA